MSELSRAKAQNNLVDGATIEIIRNRGGDWFAYEHSVAGDPNGGHLQFMQCGEGRTHEVPPECLADGAHGAGWKYRLVGVVDLTSGFVVRS